MAKKRKAGKSPSGAPAAQKTKYDVDETFDDSEDEFYSGKDKILLDESQSARRMRDIEQQEKDLQPSDEEILQYERSDDENEQLDDGSDGQPSADDDQEIVAHNEEEEEEEHWGISRSDYYNADAIETEADAIEEEEEARRLQQKQLNNMTEADFGFDENAWTDSTHDGQRAKVVVEKLPKAQLPIDATSNEKLNILRSRYPEFELLSQDFSKLQILQGQLQTTCAQSRGLTWGAGISPMLKLNVVSTYLGVIAMYFAILASNTPSNMDRKITAIPPVELREHSVITRLTRARQLWNEIKDLEVAQPIDKVKIDVPNQAENRKRESGMDEQQGTSIKRTKKFRERKHENKTVPEENLEDFNTISTTTNSRTKKKKESKLGKLQTLFSQNASEEQDSDFGDEQPLTEEQVAEKAKKKKSLRFYTSQIAQKASKRGAASREAGGDDDLPHKERLRDRQDRLMKEAEQRGRSQVNEREQLGGDDDGSDGNVEGGDDGYYLSLVSKNQKKKSDKKTRADVYAEAARVGAQVYEEEKVGSDGKRAITYAIEKNKGLTPKRKKDVRNPRVKKRKKYDEKMKKLGSVRQVYKGGEGRGGYKGELTGIKTNVVKSIKL